MFRNLVVAIAAALLPTCATVPGPPAKGLPVAPAKVADVFPTATTNVEVMTVEGDAETTALLLKMRKAAQANPDLVRAAMQDDLSKREPGHPLDYDERFGLTRDEFKALGEGLKRPLSARKVADAVLTVTFEPTGKWRLSSRKLGTVLHEGILYDPKTDAIAFEGVGELGPATPFRNDEVGGGRPLAGYSWRMERFVGTPNFYTLTGARYELIAARKAEPGKCLLVVRADKAENGLPQLNEIVMLRYDCPK